VTPPRRSAAAAVDAAAVDAAADVAAADVAAPTSLSGLVADSKVIVCCGSGGVGKTTTAAVLAIEAARLGRRAVVVTIDPARRLADALGLEGLTNTPSTIEGDWPGALAALMLDTEGTFNGLVAKYAGSEEQAEKILANRFYRNIAGAMSGTQEYMATEKLYELATETDFELIVVDTPPTRNALDFLEAPGRLARFLDHRLYRLITAPTRGIVKAVNLAAQTFLRSVAKVVGGEVIADAMAFFAAFEGMEEGFKLRARLVERLLAADDTAFVLVASPKSDTVAEATYFARKLADSSLKVKSVVVNRVHPSFGDGSPSADRKRAETFAGTALGAQYTALADLRQIAQEESVHLDHLKGAVPGAPMVAVPLLPFEVHDMASLLALGDHLFGRAPGTPA
jgi:anion-transporting  ArsA/GET3 family ATPase